MKKFIKLLLIILFILLIVGPNLLWPLLKNNEAINYNLGENRTLAEFPTTFSGNDFFADIDSWYNDNLPFRSVLHTCHSKILQVLDDLYVRFFYKEEDLDTFNEYKPEPVKTNSEDEHIHMYMEESKILPLCTDNGSAYYECECGEGFKVDYAPLGHSYEISYEIPATCTEDGLTTYTCTRCGDSYNITEKATGHNYFISQGDNISCTEQGEITYTCTICGDTYSEISTGLGHNWILVTSKEPTCEESGFEQYVCAVCGEEKTESLDLLGHNYYVKEHVDENCIDDGYTIYTCSRCDKTYTDLLVHHHNLEKISDVEASYEDYGYTLNMCTRCGSYVRTNVVPRLVKNTNKAMRYFNKITIEGRYGWLFYQADNSEQYYKGSNVLTEKQLEKYNDALVKLNDLCKKLGKKLVVMINPNKEQVYSEFYPSVAIVNSEKRVPNMVKYISTHSDVSIIYPIDELLQAKQYWQVYYRTDTHWNSAGAYIGVKALYDALSLNSIDLISLPVVPVESGAGDLVSLGNLTGNNDYSNDVNYSVKYRPDVQVSEKVENKGSLDEIILTQASEAPTTSNLVLIGDSYRNAMVQYLEKDFSSITTLHRNSINDALVRQSILNADIIVLEAVERYDSAIFDSADLIREILSVCL